MQAPSEDLQRYTSVAIILHWTIAVLVLANWPLGYFSEAIEQQWAWSPVAAHKSIGLRVLALSLVRVGWRLGHPPPAMPSSMPRWKKTAATVTHAALYVLIIALPLTGWLRTSSGKYPLTWFGLVDLPKFPIAPGSAQAATASFSHTVLGWAMVLLVALHVAAALHHQLRLRDRTMRRMMLGG